MTEPNGKWLCMKHYFNSNKSIHFYIELIVLYNFQFKINLNEHIET